MNEWMDGKYYYNKHMKMSVTIFFLLLNYDYNNKWMSQPTQKTNQRNDSRMKNEKSTPLPHKHGSCTYTAPQKLRALLVLCFWFGFVEHSSSIDIAASSHFRVGAYSLDRCNICVGNLQR
jgi:hypothetical protein